MLYSSETVSSDALLQFFRKSYKIDGAGLRRSQFFSVLLPRIPHTNSENRRRIKAQTADLFRFLLPPYPPGLGTAGKSKNKKNFQLLLRNSPHPARKRRAKRKVFLFPLRLSSVRNRRGEYRTKIRALFRPFRSPLSPKKEADPTRFDFIARIF